MYEKKTQSMPSPNSSRKFHFTSDQSWTICECCTVTRHHLGITNNPKGPLSSHVTYSCNFIFEKPEVDTCILSPTNASWRQLQRSCGSRIIPILAQLSAGRTWSYSLESCLIKVKITVKYLTLTITLKSRDSCFWPRRNKRRLADRSEWRPVLGRLLLVLMWRSNAAMVSFDSYSIRRLAAWVACRRVVAAVLLQTATAVAGRIL